MLHAYVLMPNHYHLLFEQTELGLSRGMKRLNEEYAQHFNFRHGRVGHLFQGRFKGILVERESHLLELCRYIPLNPVRCGMVKAAGEYRWSNYRATAGLVPAPYWLDTLWTLRQFDPTDFEHAKEVYREFVGSGRGAEYRPWELVVGQTYLGGSSFCENIQKLIDERPRSREYPKVQRNVARASLDEVIKCVCEEFGEMPTALRLKNQKTARKVLAYLATTESGVPLRVAAEWLGTTPGCVSRMVRWVGDRLGTDLGGRVDLIRQNLRS